jgi:sugar transferase (PEP-CTERM/EpsH1 system associated)
MGGILFLSHRLPYPPDKGEKIRAWAIFRHLAQSHRMHLGCFLDDPADRMHLPYLRTLCADLACIEIDRRWRKLLALTRLRPGAPLTIGYFQDRRLQDWVDATLARGGIDTVFTYCSAMADYVRDAPGCARILDMVDIDSEKWTDYAEKAAWPARAVWAREGRTLLEFERRAAQSHDFSLFVSQAEADRFLALAPECRGRIGWLENGVDLDRFSPARAYANPFPPVPADGPHIVFVGTMDYRPNIDAVVWFAQAVLPLLRRRPAPPCFTIVGANPTSAVRRLAACPGVHVTGRVADVRPYLAHAALVVAPLQIARGIQNKVLEAMAMGRPVLASPGAFEGIRAEAGRELLVAEGAEATARRAAEVLDGQHPGLGTAARRLVEAHYPWSATLRPLDAMLQDLA